MSGDGVLTASLSNNGIQIAIPDCYLGILGLTENDLVDVKLKNGLLQLRLYRDTESRADIDRLMLSYDSALHNYTDLFAS